jgi:YVTN family beta-propeller protein
MTLDAHARRAVQAVEELHAAALGPPPPPGDLLAGRRRRARRRKVAIGTALVVVSTLAIRLHPLAPAGPAPGQTATGPVVASIAVGRDPVAPVADDHGVWVANTTDGTVAHVDPATDRVVAVVGAGREPLALAAGAGAIWALDADGTLNRIDPAGDTLAAAIPTGLPAPVGPAAVYRPARAMAASRDAVWVSQPGHGDVLVRIDPAGAAPAVALHIGHVPVALAAAADAVWAANQDGTLTRIDQAANRVTLTVPDAGPTYPATGEVGIAVGAGAVWVSDARTRALRRIDPTSGRLLAWIRLPLPPAGLAVGAGTVWVEDRLAGALTQVDPVTNTVTGSLRVVGARPGELGTSGLAVSRDAVWVADPAGALLRVNMNRSPGTTARG